MNIQTERRDDHTARMVVELETQTLEKAKQTAAQRISKKINIPGFRRGKAPYRVIAKYVGEEAIVEDAVEIISNDVYREALDESKLEPYGPGALEEYHVEPTPTLTFTVPLQPTVVLNNYRDVRLEYTAPEVTDEQIDQVMKHLQMDKAVVEDSSRPAALGDRVTLDIHSVIELEDEDSDEDDDEGDESDEDADEHEHEHDHDEDNDDDVTFMHTHDEWFMLDPADDPIPGFSQALVGANAGDTRDFELTLPEDHADYPGKKVKFDVAVKKVENVTLPPLNDDLAARVTAEEEKPLTLLELRVRTRENMQREMEKEALDKYTNSALDAIMEQAEIKYPDAMVMDQVQQLLQRLDENLRQNRLTLNDYMQIYRQSINDLVAQYRPSAEQIVRRSLALREVGIAEQLDVTDAALEARLDEMLGMVNETERTQARTLFDNERLRDSIRESMMRDLIMERITAIARGEAPEIGSEPALSASEEPETESASSDAEAPTEVSAAASQSSEQEA